MATPHRVVSKKKQKNETYEPNERAFNKADDFHDAQGFRRRAYSGPERLTREIRTISQKALGVRGFAGVDIIEHWEEIIGSNLAKGVRPEKLTFPKKESTHGTLHVKSAGGAFAILFEHQKNYIIERINTFFGYPAVNQIRIRQGKLFLPPEPEQPVICQPTQLQLNELKQKVAPIEDAQLREMTYQIGLSLLQKVSLPQPKKNTK